MKLSTKGRYGLRILLDIALNQETDPVPLSDIARRQDISLKYLWQVIRPLATIGIVRSVRGKLGGYIMAKPLEEITLCDIVSSLEGPVALVACITESESCDRSVSCTARAIWQSVENKINMALETITLREIVELHKKNMKAGVHDYVI